MTKPSWTKGDIIALPQELAKPGTSIYRGCHVTIAEHEPRKYHGRWVYGFRDCDEIRPATIEDIDRLIEISSRDAECELTELRRLIELRQQMVKR